MCLNRCEPIRFSRLRNLFLGRRVSSGYKVVYIPDVVLCGAKGPLRDFSFPTATGGGLFGVWKRANRGSIASDSGPRYRNGFHIFTSYKAAEEYNKHTNGTIVRVLYRKPVAYGSQVVARTGCGVPNKEVPCVIAKEMCVLDPQASLRTGRFPLGQMKQETSS